MRKYLILSILFISEIVAAQQLPIFTQYRENHALLNPAILHVDHVTYQYETSVGLTYRNQWAKFSEGPKTFTARYERVFEDQNMLVGASAIADLVGPNSFTGLYGRYAYQAYFDNYSYLSAGVSVGVLQYRFNPNKSTLLQPGDAVGSEHYSAYLTDINLGIFYNQSLGRGVIFYT